MRGSGQAEDRLLREPQGRVPGVERVGDAPVGGVVLLEPGVEEVDGNAGPALAADHPSPHADHDVPAPDDDLDTGVERLEVVGGPPVHGVFDLPAGLVDLLAEEAQVVQQGDTDDGYPRVGGCTAGGLPPARRGRH